MKAQKKKKKKKEDFLKDVKAQLRYVNKLQHVNLFIRPRLQTNIHMGLYATIDGNHMFCCLIVVVFFVH